MNVKAEGHTAAIADEAPESAAVPNAGDPADGASAASNASPTVTVTQTDAPVASPAPDRATVAAPKLTLPQNDLVLDETGSVRVEIGVHNASAIVDGFALVQTAVPEWLRVDAESAHLMPGQDGILPFSLSIVAGAFVPAQRALMEFAVRSDADESVLVPAPLALVVPPSGPLPVLAARPNLVRLRDETAGSIALRIDNRVANHPRSFVLSGSDPEGAVQVGFAPESITAPAGGAGDAVLHFAVPRVDPGTELTRQLTITATGQEGAVTTLITLIQHASPAPVEVPVQARLAPSQLRVTDADTADFDVVVDNRASQSAANLAVAARDPENALAFAFTPTRITVAPGQVGMVRGRVRAARVPPGQVISHPFTVVLSDGVRDVEAAGVMELAASAAPITTAVLRVTPRALSLAGDRHGEFSIEVDNTRSDHELRVSLTGHDDAGAVGFSFSPPGLAIAPRSIGVSRLSIASPRPPTGQTAIRQLRIEATDGQQSVGESATVSQSASDRRPIARVIFVLLGGALVIIGALLPWVAGLPNFLPSFDWLVALVRMPPTGIDINDPFQMLQLGQPPVRLLVIILAVFMLFGLNGKAGGLTRKCAILIVLVSVAYLVVTAIMTTTAGVDVGLIAVWIGAILGYVGGVLSHARS
ncbi:hypothetical protein WDJ51_07210 [Rathayibacter sp. YIM 133350]|uniref:COG1470 family protein n=1 Tax=Rathayibacter sp. YIM 133350 TaxID=3131992 RepID=UPI00307DB73A